MQQALAGALQERLRPLGFVEARPVPLMRNMRVLARWVGDVWQELRVDSASWSAICQVSVAHLPVALLWVRSMQASGRGKTPSYPCPSVTAWLTKVREGPREGAPKLGGGTFFWPFEEDIDVEATADDMVEVFRAVALPMFDVTLSPEAARRYHFERPEVPLFSYREVPWLAAYLRDPDTVRSWPLIRGNEQVAQFLLDWAANGLPDTSGDIPTVAAAATLDGVPNPFPPAPPRNRGVKKRRE